MLPLDALISSRPMTKPVHALVAIMYYIPFVQIVVE
jgi:hypothetical protein